MALKIRLRQQGRKNHLLYRLVLTDSRTRRDGKYLENLGWYNPHLKQEQGVLHGEKITHWLNLGAVPTESALHLIKRLSPDTFTQYREKQAAKKIKKKSKKEKK